MKFFGTLLALGLAGLAIATPTPDEMQLEKVRSNMRANQPMANMTKALRRRWRPLQPKCRHQVLRQLPLCQQRRHHGQRQLREELGCEHAHDCSRLWPVSTPCIGRHSSLETNVSGFGAGTAFSCSYVVAAALFYSRIQGL